MAGSWPVTSMLAAERGLAVDQHLVAEPVDERVGLLGLRRGGGRDLPEVGAEVAIGGDQRVRHRGGDEGDARVGRDVGGDLLEHRRVDLLVDLGDEEERAVVARAEAVDEELVGLPGGGVLVELALVGEAQPHAEHRQRQQHEDEGADDGRRPRVVLHEPAPPVGVGLAHRAGRALRHLAP